VQPVVGIEPLRFLIFKTRVVEHESAGLTPYDGDRKWSAIPDPFGQKRSNKRCAKLANLSVAHYTLRNLDHSNPQYR
jgi:hypothetical protein